MEFYFEFLKNYIEKIAADSCLGCACRLFSHFPSGHTCVYQKKIKVYLFFNSAFEKFEKNFPNHCLDKNEVYGFLINDAETNRYF